MSNLTLPRQDSVGCEDAPPWKYLAPRPGSWKKQLFVSGRRLTAANVWLDMLTNKMTPEEAAEDWDLPLEVVQEIVCYCEANYSLITMECEEEKRALQDAGVLPKSEMKPEIAAR